MDVTPQTLTEALKAAKLGDELNCTGVFPWRSVAGLNGLTFRGGTWAGLRIDASADLLFLDATFAGQGAGFGIKAVDCNHVRVVRAQFFDFENGLAFARSNDATVFESLFRGMRADAVKFTDGVGFQADSCAMLNPRPAPLAHPDAVQVVRARGVRIANNLIRENCQGVMLTGGGFDDVQILNNRILLTRANAIFVTGATALEVAGNHVTSLGEPWSRITLIDCPDAVRRRNLVDGDERHAEVAD